MKTAIVGILIFFTAMNAAQAYAPAAQPNEQEQRQVNLIENGQSILEQFKIELDAAKESRRHYVSATFITAGLTLLVLWAPSLRLFWKSLLIPFGSFMTGKYAGRVEMSDEQIAHFQGLIQEAQTTISRARLNGDRQRPY